MKTRTAGSVFRESRVLQAATFPILLLQRDILGRPIAMNLGGAAKIKIFGIAGKIKKLRGIVMSINANLPFMGPTGVLSASKTISLLNQKERVLDHVLYEMYMFLWTTRKIKELLNDVIDWENSPEYNAYYIAQKCSLRNILELFSSTHPKVKGCETSDIYFGKIYKIPNVAEEIINSDGPLDSYRLFPNDFFKQYLDEACGRKYYGTGATIKNIVNKTVSHLTDQRFDWKNENFEQILNEKNVNDKVIRDVKSAIKAFLKVIQQYYDENLYYVYCDKNGKRKSKNLSDELKNENIATLLAAINNVM